MATLTISPNSEEGDIRGNHAVWATARALSTGTLDKMGTDTQRVNSVLSGDYYIQRGFLAFALTDSSLTTATVTGVSLRLTVGNGVGITTYVNLGSQSDTLVATDFDLVTTTNYATYTTSGIEVKNLSFNAAGIAKVQELIGSTLKLCLRDQFDHGDSAPTGTENENALWRNQTWGTEAQRPLLTVTYTLPSSFFALL